MNKEQFGDYLKRKRLEHEHTLRGFAKLMGFTSAFLCDIEKNRKAAPSDDRLRQIITLLSLDKDESNTLLDLAAASRKRSPVSNDLPEYIMENEVVRLALRTAKEVKATDAEWLEFVEKLNARTIMREDMEK